MDKVQPDPTEVKIRVLMLSPSMGATHTLDTVADGLEFTGNFFDDLRGFGPEFDGELKAVFTRKGLGGCYLKAGRQPEEAHELARRHPGQRFTFGQPLELRVRQGVKQ